MPQKGVSVAELKDACKCAVGVAAKEACEDAEPDAGDLEATHAFPAIHSGINAVNVW